MTADNSAQLLTDFDDVMVGPRLDFAETWIQIDGTAYPAITILEAARLWHMHAKEKGWTVHDTRGRKVVWDERV